MQWQRPKSVSLAIILSTYFLSHCYYITISVCTCSDLQFQHCRMHRRRIKPTEPHPRLPQTVRYALFGGEARERNCRLSGHTGSVRATRCVHGYFARLMLHGECCISEYTAHWRKISLDGATDEFSTRNDSTRSREAVVSLGYLTMAWQTPLPCRSNTPATSLRAITLDLLESIPQPAMVHGNFGRQRRV